MFLINESTEVSEKGLALLVFVWTDLISILSKPHI